MRNTVILNLLLLLATPAAAQSADALEHGRAVNKWLLTGQSDSLVTRLSAEFLAAIGGRAGLDQFIQQIGQLGDELAIVDEQVYTSGDQVAYYRVARFAATGEQTITSTWSWVKGGPAMGMQVQPTPQPAPTEFAHYQTKTPLELPFEGNWYVFWGGRTPHQNYHVVAADQRFAYDLVVQRDGATHTGDGDSDYYCFGEPILAPAAGRITAVVDGIADNAPGEMNAEAPAGNHVIVDHGNGEFSLLAHLRQNTVSVDVGDEVSSGEQLGFCGNSGNSSEPHLHYHLQTGAAFGAGVGLPAYFNGYLSNGEFVERGEPVRGQTIAPAGSN